MATHKPFLALALVVLAGVAAFGGVLGNQFLWDDGEFIVNNLVLDDWRNLPLLFLSADSVGLGGENPYYRPFTTLTFAVDKALWKDRPLGFHATNLLLHLGVSVLVFLLALRWTATFPALAAGALFAVHPVHAEAVGYISARADLLCALFTLGSFLAFVQWSRGEGPGGSKARRGWFLALSLGLFLLAMFSKILGLLVLPLLLAHLAWPERKSPRGWAVLIPFALLALGFLLLRSGAVELDRWVEIPLETRVATAGGVLLTQVSHLLFPVGLRPYYVPVFRDAFSSPAAIGGWLGFTALAAAGLAFGRKNPPAAAGTILFAGALFATCGAAFFIYPTPVADRFLYLPLAGAALAGASLLHRTLSRPLPSAVRMGAGVLLAGALMAGVAASAARVPVWRDSLTFWREAERSAPGHAIVLSNLGASFSAVGRLDEAEAVYRRLAANGAFPALVDYNLGRIDYLRGDLPAAEAHCAEALQRNPRFTAAMALLGRCRLGQGKAEEARLLVAEAGRLDPYNRDIRGFEALLAGTREAEGVEAPPLGPVGDAGTAGETGGGGN